MPLIENWAAVARTPLRRGTEAQTERANNNHHNHYELAAIVAMASGAFIFLIADTIGPRVGRQYRLITLLARASSEAR
jgi:hypothetical protein